MAAPFADFLFWGEGKRFVPGLQPLFFFSFFSVFHFNVASKGYLNEIERVSR